MLLLFATPLFAGLRQRRDAAADRRARRRVPATERLRLLALPLRRDHHRRRLLHPAGRRVVRLVRLRAAVEHDIHAGSRRQPLGVRPRAGRFRHDPRCRQLHHHDHHDARARHDDVPHADLHLEHPGDVDPGAAGLPGARRRPDRPRRRPRLRRASARSSQRRSHALAAPVLVLRAPRGLHHRAAVLRHHQRGAAGLQPQADLRLQDADLRDDRDRRPVGHGVGAPHVRHRLGAAAVLRAADDADRGARPA